jgi:hypothetical protein
VEAAVILRGDRCRCSNCGELFNSTAAHVKHRRGEYRMSPPDYGRRCLTPDEMLAAKMAKNAAGFWIGSQMPAVTRSVIAGDAQEQNGYQTQGEG